MGASWEGGEGGRQSGEVGWVEGVGKVAGEQGGEGGSMHVHTARKGVGGVESTL